MKALHVLAAIVLGFEMPVPVFWLILHGRVNFWRRHVRAGYWVAILCAWGGGSWLFYYFRQPLFHWRSFPALLAGPGGVMTVWAPVAGLAFIVLDLGIFVAAETVLGGRRLVGHAELTGRAQLATRGLYTRVRHPRYLGMMAGVLGGCLVVSSLPMWILGASWLLLALLSIRLEERELRVRFGSAYADYARRVPALLPYRFRSRPG